MWFNRLTPTTPRPEICRSTSGEGTVQLARPLPSLSEQIALPEPHPNYHAVLDSLRTRRFSQVNLVDHPSTAKRKTLSASLAEQQSKRTTSPDSSGQPDTPTDAKPYRAAGSKAECVQTANPAHVGGRQVDKLPQGIALQRKACPSSTTLHPPCIPSDRIQGEAGAQKVSVCYPSSSRQGTTCLTPRPHVQRATTSPLQKKGSVAGHNRRGSGGLLSAASLFEMGLVRPAALYLTGRHDIIAGKYATATDQRGYIPVYEYEVNGSAVLIDAENSYVLLTGICKALGPMRADLVRHVESVPELECLCRKIRGGFLKIQGTWVPYKLAYELCRRVAWRIRMDLVPIFGHDFPGKCLAPLDPGFGDLRILTSARRTRRSPPAASSMNSAATEHKNVQRSKPIVTSPFQSRCVPSNNNSNSNNNNNNKSQQRDYREQAPLNSTTNRTVHLKTGNSSLGLLPQQTPNKSSPTGDPINSLSTCARSYLTSTNLPSLIEQAQTSQQQQQSRSHFSPRSNVGHHPYSARSKLVPSVNGSVGSWHTSPANQQQKSQIGPMRPQHAHTSFRHSRAPG